MSKRPTDGYEPAAKKRGSERQLTKDTVSDDEEVEEQGSIPVASDEVMKTRKIVRARRGTAAPPTTPAAGVPSAKSNPFANISLMSSNAPAVTSSAPQSSAAEAVHQASSVAGQPEQSVVEEATAEQEGTRPVAVTQTHSVASVEAQDTGKTLSQETVKNKATAESAPEASTSVEQTESPIMGTLSPHPAQSNGSIVSGGPATGSFASFAANRNSFASIGASKPHFNVATFNETAGSTNQGDDKSKPFSFGPLPHSSPAFSFKPIGGGFPVVPGVFAAIPANSVENGSAEELEAQDSVKPALAVLPPETETVTGEENETQIWAGEGTLYEFNPPQAWKERGKGEMRINKGPGRSARFVLRQRGHHRLLLNANLWPDMKVTKMDGGKGATFPVLNVARLGDEAQEAEPKLQTFAFRVKSAAQMEAFIDVVNTQKQVSSQTAP